MGYVSWPSHDMILLDKAVIKLPEALDILYKRRIWFKNTTNIKFRAKVSFKRVSISPPMTAGEQSDLSFLTF